jgi:hypothetical protein
VRGGGFELRGEKLKLEVRTMNAEPRKEAA